jgi:hypothetical protein
MVDNNKQTNNHIDGPFDKAMEHWKYRVEKKEEKSAFNLILAMYS